MKFLTLIFLSIFMTGCGAVAKTEIAPYQVLQSTEEKPVMEVRHYESLVLVSTPMNGEGRNGAFRLLFKYISGANVGEASIEMTAPVFMDKDKKDGVEIPMTAPVFMDENTDTPMMSFVLPANYTIETAPKPTAEAVSLSEIKDYTTAVIIFNGRLSESNIAKHQAILEGWIKEKNLEVIGAPKTAGYNAPFTLPMFRRNEVLIPVKKP